MRKKLAIIPSFLMLLLAFALVFTATYAWLAMNRNVVGGDIVVQAEVEDGLVISTSADPNAGTWSERAVAVYPSTTLLPTSTHDTTAWYYNRSTNINDAQVNQPTASYTTLSGGTYKLSDASGRNGVWFNDNVTTDNAVTAGEKKYYLLNTFSIMSSGNEFTLTSGSLKINKVAVTGISTGATGGAAFDASLRIAVVLSCNSTTDTFIFAPVSGATLSYTVNGTDATTATAAVGVLNAATSFTTIPGLNSTGDKLITAKVYAYFEGEDPQCKTINLKGKTLDSLKTSVIFGIGDTDVVAVDQQLTNVTSSYNVLNYNIVGGDLVITYTGTAGYDVPGSVTVTIGGVEKTVGTDYSYSTGTLTIPQAKLTGNVVITVTGVAS